ncbi:hypothetical protein CC80DRAFT_364046, partial [Byssothecium circinans]
KNAKVALKFEEEKLGFMPFAFVCTADNRESREFGMKMIALLVATVCGGLRKRFFDNDKKKWMGWTLDNEMDLPPVGEPLNTDRQAYEGLMLSCWEEVGEMR